MIVPSNPDALDMILSELSLVRLISVVPFTIFPNTQKKDTRARARFASLKIENDAAGETWRYGSFRLDAQPDGRR